MNMHKRTRLTPLDRGGNMAFMPNPTMESDALGRTLPSESPDHLFGTQKARLQFCAE